MFRQRPLVTKTILRWYRANGRALPWRNIRDPYKVFISEVMLQQTQVSRVLEKFPLFLERFPSFDRLARARKSSVVRAWRGMGYNNRAIRLQQTAKRIVRDFDSRLPVDVRTLQSLPGIGKYSANALASFIGKAHVPVVETNVRRVLSRLFPAEARQLDEWELARRVLPRTHAYDWNQALMDFGATVCKAVAPKCRSCPLENSCPSAFVVTSKKIRSKPNEPSRYGIPNRVYRGRIVEILRGARTHAGLRVAEIGKRILPRFGKNDEAWLNRVLNSLELDGLVARKIRANKRLIELAD